MGVCKGILLPTGRHSHRMVERGRVKPDRHVIPRTQCGGFWEKTSHSKRQELISHRYPKSKSR